MKKAALLAGLFLVASVPISAHAQVNTKDDTYYKAIVAEASRDAENQVKESFDLYWKLFASFGGLFIVGFGIFGYRQLQDLRQILKDEIKNDLRSFVASAEFTDQIKISVEKNVVGELKSDTARLERQIILGRLEKMIKNISSSDLPVNLNEQLDQLLEYILRLKDDALITNSVEFQQIIGDALNLFYENSQWKKADQLEEQFSGSMSEITRFFVPLVVIYGFRVLAEVASGDHVVKKLYEYYEICKTRNYLELAAPYILAYEYWSAHAQASEKISKLLEAVNQLSIQDQKRFITTFDQKCDPKNLASNPQPRHFALASKFNAVATSYKVQLDKIRLVVSGSDVQQEPA